MAAVTTTRRYVTALGPLKLEIADLASVDDADTYNTLIQNPVFGCFVMNTDNNADAQSVNLSFSGKTVTFNNSSIGAESGVAFIFGF